MKDSNKTDVEENGDKSRVKADKAGTKNGNASATGVKAGRPENQSAQGTARKDDLKRFEQTGRSTVPIKALWDAIDIVEGMRPQFATFSTLMRTLPAQAAKDRSKGKG